MTLENNKIVVGRFVEEVFNKRNLAAVDELVAANAIDHYKQGLTFSLLMAAFPDLHLTVKTTIAEGDKVTVLSTMSGTHQGTLMGISPTNRTVSVTKADIFRVAEGKIVESWQNGDYMGIMQQIGAVDIQRLTYYLQVKPKEKAKPVSTTEVPVKIS